MNINVKRYYNSIGIDGFIKRLRKYPNNKFGRLLFRFNEKIHSFLIIGFRYIKDENIKDGRTWNNNYHLFSKLCRYETWTDVKITWWDKIRFKIVTGYKFE